MGYNSDSFDNRLDTSVIDFSRPVFTSVQFYSPLFLQRLKGNKWSFLSFTEKRRTTTDMENISDDEESFFDTGQNLTTTTLIPEYNNDTTITNTLSIPTTISSTLSVLPPPPDNVVENTTISSFFENVLTNYTDGNNNTSLPDMMESDSSEKVFTIFNGTISNANNNGSRGLFLGGKLDMPEYAVFGGVLLLSAVIGVVFGCFCSKGKKPSTADYLIANRQMSTIPAALSLLCSFVSAITILGNPLEIYNYGSSYGLIVITFIPLTLSLSYFYCPVFHNLQLTSAYEYFELRFNRTVRTVISLVGILHYIVYLSIVVYGPALAIGQVTGINTRMSTAVIFAICIFYSTLGGLKGVIATDALQAIIMIGSLMAIVWKGTQDMGGFVSVWNIAEKGGRTDFFNYDLDPRTRHTMWTAIIGGYLQWLPNFAATHSQVQRYLSMPSLTSIRRALALNLIGLMLIFGLCYWAGLILYANYHTCDPLQTGAVTRPDQLLPLFVMQSMDKYSGLVGLFVAGLCCASLSTVSTGLNALSAIVTYDYLRAWWPLLNDGTLLHCSRSLCILFGVASFGFMFIAENLGNILPAAFSISGIVVGPTLGVYTLGMFFPHSNSKGSLLGLLSAFFIMITLVIGNQLADYEKLLPNQTLPGLSTEGCLAENLGNIFSNNSISQQNTTFLLLPPFERQTFGHLEEWGNEFVLSLFSISYMWYPGLGAALTVFFGLLFSLMIGSCDNFQPVCPHHLSPPVLWMWLKCFPSHALKWIDIEVEDYPMITSHSATLSLRSSDFSFRKESVCDMKLKRIAILPRQIPFPPPRFVVQPTTSSTASDSLS